MPAAAEKKSNDPMVGYFASVVVALLCNSLWAGFLADAAGNMFPSLEVSTLRQNFAAGLFIAIAFSNPVGAFINRSGFRRVLVRMGLGFIAGVAIQVLFLTPVGGKGMSIYLLLLVSSLAVPGMLMISTVRNFLDGKKIVPADHLASVVLRILSWPDRVLFVLLMGVSFSLFWQFTSTPNQVMIILAVVLVVLTFWVTMRHVPKLQNLSAEELEQQVWLEFEPDVEITQVARAIARLKSLFQTLLPGAILFGGVMRLAVEFLFLVFPNLNLDLSDPTQAMQSMGIVIVSGLAVVLFGMMAALGFSLLVIQLIGKVKGWSQQHLRENYLHMIRAMYFRPLDRA